MYVSAYKASDVSAVVDDPDRVEHAPARPAYKAVPVPLARRRESCSIAKKSMRQQEYEEYNSPTLSASISSPTRSTFSDPPRARLPPSSVSPPPRIVIERRPTHTSPPQPPTALASDSPVRNPYRHRSPARVVWSTSDLTTASLLLHTLQQPGYRPRSRSGASSTSSRSSSLRHQQQQQRPQSQQGRVQSSPYSTTFNPERYFAGLEPIADSEPECARSDLEYDRNKTIRSKGKDRTSSLLEDDEERNQATVKSTGKEKGRTFISAQWLRKLLDTSPAPGSKEGMLAVQQPREPPRAPMTYISPNPTNPRSIPKRRSTSTLNTAPRFFPSPSTLPSTSTSTATASVARLKAIPLTPEEQEEEKLRAAEKRRSGMKGSRQGTPVMGSVPLALSDGASNPSISGSSTPRSVSFAVEPPKYSVERERDGEGATGRRVERERGKRKKRRKDGEEGDADAEKGGWMSWFLDVSSGLTPPGAVVGGRFDERMGGRGPGGGAPFDFGL